MRKMGIFEANLAESFWFAGAWKLRVHANWGYGVGRGAELVLVRDGKFSTGRGDALLPIVFLLQPTLIQTPSLYYALCSFEDVIRADLVERSSFSKLFPQYELGVYFPTISSQSRKHVTTSETCEI